ncbi:MAG: hypothetical protein KC917_18840 [Candidatus Omnitrophica bacterium]|nr:hypothetical protein [Candidatus Omnitrophota bacterium]
MFRSLLWKEWREQRWKAAFGAVVLGAFAAIGLKTRIMPDGQVVFLAMVISASLFPMFVCIGLVAAEREESTLPYLLRLPSPNWAPLIAKISVAAFVLLLPILTVCGVYTILAWNREVESWRVLYWGPIVWGISIEVLIWFLTLGISRQRQDSAAIVALLVMAAWVFVVIVFGAFQTIESMGWFKWVVAVQPLGYTMFSDPRFGSVDAGVFTLLHGTVLILLIYSMFRRFPTLRSARS